MVPKSQNYFEYRIMFFQVGILEIKTNFHMVIYTNEVIIFSFFSAQILVFSLKQTCTINEFKALEPAEWNETGQSLPQLVLKDSKCQKIPPLKVHLENNEGKIFTHKQPHLLYLLQYFTQVSNRFNQ